MVGAGKVGTTGEAFGEKVSGQETGREILYDDGESGASVWVRDVGNDPSAGEGPQGFPPLVSTAAGGHGPQMSMEWYMGVPTDWGSSGNRGAG